MFFFELSEIFKNTIFLSKTSGGCFWYYLELCVFLGKRIRIHGRDKVHRKYDRARKRSDEGEDSSSWKTSEHSLLLQKFNRIISFLVKHILCFRIEALFPTSYSDSDLELRFPLLIWIRSRNYWIEASIPEKKLQSQYNHPNLNATRGNMSRLDNLSFVMYNYRWHIKKFWKVRS